VLALRRAVGFLPNARLERFVVIQADEITRAIETVLVAPLDESLAVYAHMPGAVPVSAREAGTQKKQVALITQLAALPTDRFEPSAVGRVEAGTRTHIDRVLELVLDLG
jgi:mRNA-degrading endonuclease toxin of MazEF toxin-antitoxin module